MNLLRLFIGARDYNNRWGVAIAILGVEIEIAKARVTGFYVSLEWHWLQKIGRRWRVVSRCQVWYLDWFSFWWERNVRAPLRRWWAKCAWNADRLEDPFQ